jgi:PTH1 family peptidyl-tRNA hydrolase
MDNDVPTHRPLFLVGLGSPAANIPARHNIRFLVIDQLAARLETMFSRVQLRSLVTDARYQGRRVLLAKPQTYMNESGVAVGALIKFHKVPLTNILVAHDDVDLPFGTLRLRPGEAPGQGSEHQNRINAWLPRLPGWGAAGLAGAAVLQNFSARRRFSRPC